MNFLENIMLALESIRTNILRSFLTIMIIAIGIACLVGILTSTDTILYSLSNSFNRVGANSFSIHPSRETIKTNTGGEMTKRSDPIVFDQAVAFKEKYDHSGALTAISTYCTGSAEIKFENEKTNPTVRVYGIDENYLDASAYEVNMGRNFTATEVLSGEHKVIIGKDIVDLLFKERPSAALGQTIQIGATRYKVTGVLSEKGSAVNNGADRRVFIPLMNAKQYYGYPEKRYGVMAVVQNTAQLDKAISAAIGTMRNVRKLKVTEPNDFDIRKSDGILERLKEMTTQLRLATFAIVIITLIGAAIGLMNIMLVSVTERTREIGLRKAIGATSSNVLTQFLMEAVVITLIGGVVGILFGLGIGFGISHFMDANFIAPVQWMILAFVVCGITGVVSGLYPAIKAARLDPIESLRYE